MAKRKSVKRAARKTAVKKRVVKKLAAKKRAVKKKTAVRKFARQARRKAKSVKAAPGKKTAPNSKRKVPKRKLAKRKVPKRAVSRPASPVPAQAAPMPIALDKNAFLISLSESERTDFGRVAFDQQPESQKVFSAIWELESQVNNGGFDQYFRSSDSDMIAYAPTALRAIGAASCSGIVEQAIQVIAPLLSTQEERELVLEGLADEARDRLESLDTEFFKYPDNLTELLFEFVRLAPEAFGSIP